jgi:hypothetical protein
MGRPIGSVNREKPFADMLRVALLSGGGRRLRIIADKLAEKAEQGDLQAIQQIADRLDGKPAQSIERGGDHSRRITRAVRRTKPPANLRAYSAIASCAVIRDREGGRRWFRCGGGVWIAFLMCTQKSTQIGFHRFLARKIFAQKIQEAPAPQWFLAGAG